MISAATQSIITSYEELGMSPEEIAEAEGLELLSVKSALIQFSSKYKQSIKKDPELGFDDEQLMAANRTIVEVMNTSDDDGLRLRAAMYLRNDKKGRLDAARAFSNIKVNILQFNEDMKKAMKAIGGDTKLLNNENESTIEVETVG